MDLAEEVYDTLWGERILPIHGVPNALEEGKICAQWYAEAMEAAQRLRSRLGSMDEDEDVEAIIDCLLLIQRNMCLEMFRLGTVMREKNSLRIE